jgi:hypothetical protein
MLRQDYLFYLLSYYQVVISLKYSPLALENYNFFTTQR